MKQLSLIFLLVSFYSSIVQAFDIPQTPSHTINEKSMKVGFRFKSFQSTGAYSDLGETLKFSASDYFRKDDLLLNFAYGLGKSLDISGGVNLRMNSSKTEDYNGSIFGVESLYFSSKYKMRPLGNFLFAWNIYYKTSLFSAPREASPTRPLALGDEGQEVGFDLIGSLKLSKSFALVSSGGYERPPSGLSSEIPYQFGLLWEEKGWGVQAGLKGNFSLKQDPYSQDPENKPGIEIPDNSPSELYNSVNRSLMVGHIAFMKYFERWGVGGSFEQVISGFSTDIGWGFGINLVWQSEGLSKRKRKKKKFKEYDLDATITKVSPRGGFAKLDKGYNQYIEKGMKMDIYESDFRGRNVLVGTGVVYETKPNWSILKIIKKYIDRPLKPGLIVRGKL